MPARAPIPAVAYALHLDSVAAAVIDDLEQAGVDCILLKGPVHAAWLYRDGGFRPYGDIDLLIAEQHLGAAGELLAARGFVRTVDPALGLTSLAHEDAWHRADDHAHVELHSKIPGLDADAATQWRMLSAETDEVDVGGRVVRALSEPARVLHVAVHAAWHAGDERPQPVSDLERALDLVDFPVWSAAARLAQDLSATSAFVSGLRLVPAGSRMADELALPSPRGLRHRAPKGPGWGLLAILDGAEGSRGRALLRYALPPASYMRQIHPIAGRGRVGLALAHMGRIAGLAKAPRTFYRAACASKNRR